MFMQTGGGWYLLGVQSFSVCCLFLWGLIITYPIIWIVNKLIPIRLDPQDEILGCDIVEHFMGDENEKMLPPLDQVQIASMRMAGSPANYANPSIETYKEFDTVERRRTFHLNHGYERDAVIGSHQHPTERL